MTGSGGRSSTLRLLCSITDVSVYWVGRSSRAMTPDVNPRSRGAMHPRFAFISRPSNRGRRESRVRAAPAVSCASCTKKCAHEHTGPAEASRLSLRDGFTAYFALSPVNGLSCHRRRRDTSRQLDASIAAPGPHDFAVRVSHARQSQLSRPPHPTARS
jgi:hypothetical protein